MVSASVFIRDFKQEHLTTENSLLHLSLFFFDVLVRPKFTSRKMKSFMVVKAGNSVRITINFEVSLQLFFVFLKIKLFYTKEEKSTVQNPYTEAGFLCSLF